VPSIKRYLPFGLKRWVKESAAAMFNIPMSRFDVPISLMKVLPRKRPITLIDLGASTGSFTSVLDRYCGIKKALLIEPQPKRIETMKAKLPGNRFSFACAAVSSEESTIEMDILNWDYSSSILPVRRDIPTVTDAIDLGVRERIQVQASTLDNLCAAHRFDGFIDLLKIDVQGAEGLALAGAADVLRRTGLIWMELSLQPLYEGCVTIEGMIKLCRDHGFKLTDLEDCFRGSDGELLCVDALFSSK
jgi:FkbM family methyltransferase